MWVEDFTFDEVGKIISINLEDQVKKGQLVKQKGTTSREGEAVLKKADVLNPFRLGLLATAGIGELSVVAKPRVAYLPTGSELIPAGQTPKRGQNVESNSLMVEATLQSWGADMVKMPIVADQRTDLAKALDDALQKADIVLLNRGTSMGTEDYTSALLSKRASHFQHGVRCIPGIPVAVAIVDGKPVINLPGPPYAAFCALDWCVRAMVYYWNGLPVPQRRNVIVTLQKPLHKPPLYEMYVRLVIQGDSENGYTAEVLPRDVPFADAADRWNGLFIAPIGIEKWDAGSEINAEWLYTEGSLRN